MGGVRGKGIVNFFCVTLGGGQKGEGDDIVIKIHKSETLQSP